jgi:ribonucleoside-diphosphate reductase alpha chain
VVDLAGAMIKMRYPYASREGKQLNKMIFETMYYAAVSSSVAESEKHGPYTTFAGSPLSRGQFQFDLWGAKPATNRYDWEALRRRVMTKGVRNSLLIALMPTATTAQLIGGCESFEPLPSNLFVRRTLGGEVVLLNKSLVQDLQDIHLWTPAVIRKLVKGRGSIQEIEEIPPEIRQLYRTVWEIPMKDQIDMSADRAPYVCQSQSFNVHLAVPTPEALTKLHFRTWNKGLKTGMYYLRSRPVADPIQITADNELVVDGTATQEAAPPPSIPSDTLACTRESGCTSCQC